MKNRVLTITPGKILFEEFMQPYGMSVNKLAGDIHVPPNRISQIVRGHRQITPDTAMRLGRYFGNGVQFWLNLQHNYDLRLAQDELEDQINRDVVPFKPIAHLKRERK